MALWPLTLSKIVYKVRGQRFCLTSFVYFFFLLSLSLSHSLSLPIRASSLSLAFHLSLWIVGNSLKAIGAHWAFIVMTEFPLISHRRAIVPQIKSDNKWLLSGWADNQDKLERAARKKKNHSKTNTSLKAFFCHERSSRNYCQVTKLCCNFFSSDET